VSARRYDFEHELIERFLEHLHNTLLLEIVGAACTSEPDTLTTNTIIPTNKRRRIHPYQGNDDDADTYHSARLKSWIVSLPKVERQDIKTGGSYAETHSRDKRTSLDEVRQERGYELNPQGKPYVFQWSTQILIKCQSTTSPVCFGSMYDNEDRSIATRSTSTYFCNLFGAWNHVYLGNNQDPDTSV
jgi:hypothetical protein